MTGIGARAHVERDFPTDSVAIWLGRRGEQVIETYEPAELQTHIVARGDPGAYEVRSPSLRLPEDIARALLDALAEHFGGYSAIRTLRRDYEAERVRVDRFITHLTREVPGER